MQPKEIVMVAGGAILLTNLSIIATLIMSGYFDDGSSTEIAEEQVQDSIEQAPPPEPLPPPAPALHSMSKAIYACEDRLNESNSGKTMSYQFNSAASRYNDDDQIYQIFIETQTTSRFDAPMVTAEVTCEVSATDMSIVAFSSMKE